jgi:hypothetical protein
LRCGQPRRRQSEQEWRQSPKLAAVIWNTYSELAKSGRTTVGHQTCCCGVVQPQLFDALGAPGRTITFWHLRTGLRHRGRRVRRDRGRSGTPDVRQIGGRCYSPHPTTRSVHNYNCLPPNKRGTSGRTARFAGWSAVGGVTHGPPSINENHRFLLIVPACC